MFIYIYSYIYFLLTNIYNYCHCRPERSLFRRACRNTFDDFGLWATRCTDLPPICIRMHPYAFICIRMHPYALFTPLNTSVQHFALALSCVCHLIHRIANS